MKEQIEFGSGAVFKAVDGEVSDPLRGFGPEPIFAYTLEDAENDGVLVKTSEICPEFNDHTISHVTNNLLSKGFRDHENQFKIDAVMALLSKGVLIVLDGQLANPEEKEFFEGFVTCADPVIQDRVEVFVQRNELGKFTMMLTEDY